VRSPLLDQASSFSGQVDSLLLFMLLLSAVIVVGVCTVLAWFAVESTAAVRRRTAAEAKAATSAIELTWTLLPLGIFLGLFVWSIELFRADGNAADSRDAGRTSWPGSGCGRRSTPAASARSTSCTYPSVCR